MRKEEDKEDVCDVPSKCFEAFSIFILLFSMFWVHTFYLHST